MFKKNFIRLCSDVGESPSFVCQKVGISSAAFSQWNDKTIPRKVTQQRIADYFGITVDELMEEDAVPSVRVNNGIIGNYNQNNAVSVGATAGIGDIEKEILSICQKLDMKRKNALLTRAYELLDSNN